LRKFFKCSFNTSIVCTSDSIHDNRVIELIEQIIGESLTNISVRQQWHADYQSRYRSRKRQLYCLDINRIDDINEYYIGSMDVFCIHCNAKHFAAEKISNKGNSFHDCCNHVLRPVDSTILFFQRDLVIVMILKHTRENRM